MSTLRRLLACTAGNPAVEMAMVLPLLLMLLCGSVELGNYFYNEHILVKAVRDGARYAARQDLTNFTGCSGTPGGTVKADTVSMVKTGLLSGGTARLANVDDTTVSVTVSCSTSVGGSTLAGIYTNVKNSSGTVVGAPIVTVTAAVPYDSLMSALWGFRGNGYKLNASQQAAVKGW